jgi:hypothetical protein
VDRIAHVYSFIRSFFQRALKSTKLELACHNGDSGSCDNAGVPREYRCGGHGALRQLRLSGMAGTLETRLLQAQSEAMATIDLISILVSDELSCRSQRLLDRRHKQARFRDANKTLDTFDF